MSKKLQAILYILNCNEGLRAKVLPYIAQNPDLIQWQSIRELSRSPTEQRLVLWMERLAGEKEIELPSELGAGGSLEVGPDLPTSIQRVCLKAFAIRSNWAP